MLDFKDINFVDTCETISQLEYGDVDPGGAASYQATTSTIQTQCYSSGSSYTLILGTVVLFIVALWSIIKLMSRPNQ